MSKFKRIISLLLAIVSFCVLELANPLQTLAEELNQPPTAETAVFTGNTRTKLLAKYGVARAFSGCCAIQPG